MLTHYQKSEGKASEEIGIKALGTIAKARQSNMLNNFILTGEQQTTMSVDEALRHLNIEQKLEELDPTLVPVLFDAARQDRPGDWTEKAIAAIQQALANGPASDQTPENWPVGLTSHGNTCYLNSLLQYYFSIRPLRNIVLDYDHYKWDTETQGLKDLRVGHVHVTRIEIEGGQRFAEELKQLFQRMIQARDSAVKPDADLVCRAFLKPKDYKLMDPIMNPEKERNGDSAIANGTENAIDEKMTDGDIVTSPAASSTTMIEGKGSDASSMTLVNGDNGDSTMKDAAAELTPPPSPEMEGMELAKEEPKPPPLPARRFSTTKEEALQKAQENARAQQDVTEVHDSITSLLRNGMSPSGKDFEDEQEDVLRALFSIQTAQTTVKDGVEGKPTPQFDSAINLNVPYEDTDIYSALDAVFDLQPRAEDAALEAYRTMKSIGPLLQISIPRIGYDSTRGRGAVFKTTSTVKLEDELYLDRYFDTSHPETPRRRRECWAWRKKLQTLKRELNALKDGPSSLTGPDVIARTAEYLISLDDVNRDLESVDVDTIEADGGITSTLLAEAKEQANRVTVLEAEIATLQNKLAGQWTDMKNIKYRLAAAFFHRGSYGHGHYWIYIHDFKNDLWRLYNDEKVEKFNKLEQVFEAKGWEQGTPTYAVYVAADQIQDTIDPVCRDPEPAPEPPPLERCDSSTDLAGGSTGEQTNGFKPHVAVDPVLTADGGEKKWDEQRQVQADVQW